MVKISRLTNKGKYVFLSFQKKVPFVRVAPYMGATRTWYGGDSYYVIFALLTQ